MKVRTGRQMLQYTIITRLNECATSAISSFRGPPCPCFSRRKWPCQSPSPSRVVELIVEHIISTTSSGSLHPTLPYCPFLLKLNSFDRSWHGYSHPLGAIVREIFHPTFTRFQYRRLRYLQRLLMSQRRSTSSIEPSTSGGVE